MASRSGQYALARDIGEIAERGDIGCIAGKPAPTTLMPITNLVGAGLPAIKVLGLFEMFGLDRVAKLHVELLAHVLEH